MFQTDIQLETKRNLKTQLTPCHKKTIRIVLTTTFSYTSVVPNLLLDLSNTITETNQSLISNSLIVQAPCTPDLVKEEI